MFFVYLIYEHDEGEPVYIGRSTQPFERLRQHRKEKSWWEHGDFTIKVKAFSTFDEMAAEEIRLITEKNPRDNIAGTGRGQPRYTCRPAVHLLLVEWGGIEYRVNDKYTDALMKKLRAIEAKYWRPVVQNGKHIGVECIIGDTAVKPVHNDHPAITQFNEEAHAAFRIYGTPHPSYPVKL
jgi:hypothetical protein